MKIISCLLAFCVAFSGLSPAEDAKVASQQEVCTTMLEQREAKPKKSKKRNVGRAAQQKKKALREQGVKKVHAKSPSGWPDRIPVPDDTTL